VAKAATIAGRRIFVAKDSFVGDVDGLPVVFNAGQTRVREGHPILDIYADLFEELDVQYEVEAASAAPGETRGE
jgi:hypothetical protein